MSVSLSKIGTKTSHSDGTCHRVFLALDVSGPQAVVLLGHSQGIYGGRIAPLQAQASQTLLPLVHELLDETKFSFEDIDQIFVGVGPGSFTGIRIALATGKAWSWVRKIPLTGISSLKILGNSVPDFVRAQPEECMVATNAYQSMVFLGKGVPWKESVLSSAQWFQLLQKETSSSSKQLVVDPFVFLALKQQDYYQDLLNHFVIHSLSQATIEGLFYTVISEINTKNESSSTSWESIQATYLRPPQAQINLEMVFQKSKLK